MTRSAFCTIGRRLEQDAPAGNADILLVVDQELAFDDGAAGKIDVLSPGEAYRAYVMDAGRIVKGIGIGFVRYIGFRGAGKELEVVEDIPVGFNGEIAGFVEFEVEGIVPDGRLDLVGKWPDA